MKLGFLADTHLRSSTPACRKDTNFYDTQMFKLAQVVDTANQRQWDYILHAGDLFDAQEPTLKLMHDTMAILNKSHAKWIVNPGNHDFFGANTETLRRSGLGILWQAGLIDTVDKMTDIQLGVCTVRLIPYSINVDPSSYLVKECHTKVYICVTHEMLTTHWQPFDHRVITDVKTDADIVLCSHWHSQFDVEQGSTVFLNTGPLTRQKTTEYNVSPRVGELVIQDNKITHSFIPLLCSKSELVMEISQDNDVKKPQIAEDFLATLKASAVDTIDRQTLVRSVGEHHKFSKDIIDKGLGRLTEAEKLLDIV